MYLQGRCHRSGAEPVIDNTPRGGPQRREIGILLPNNQRQHRTSLAPIDMLPLCICAHYCAPCQPILRAFFEWIRSPPPTRGDPQKKSSHDSLLEGGCPSLSIPIEVEITLYSRPKFTTADTGHSPSLSLPSWAERESSLLSTYWSESTVSS